MSIVAMNPFLRRALIADALIGLPFGAALTVGATPLQGLLNLPVSLLVPVGLVLLPWAAFLLWLASRSVVRRSAVWTVIAINVLWIVESAWVSLGGVFEPSGIGHAFIALQAVAVAVLAELEFIGLRRAEPAQSCAIVTG